MTLVSSHWYVRTEEDFSRAESNARGLRERAKFVRAEKRVMDVPEDSAY
jgi:hypothetical protein